MYKFRAHDTVQDLYDLLLFNNLQVSESKEKYKLCNKAGVEFRPQMPIWSYGTKSVRTRPPPPHISSIPSHSATHTLYSLRCG